MEKEVASIGFYPQTNSTRVYYSDGSFDAFGGNVVLEKAQELGFPLDTDIDDTTDEAPDTFSPSEDSVEDEEITNEDNQVNNGEGNQEDGGGDSDGGTGEGVHVTSEPSDGTGVPEIESVDAGGDAGSVSVEGDAGDVPSSN